MTNLEIRELKNKYSFLEGFKGVSVEQPLDFQSPYGCSKGSADQYFCDYARSFGLKTTVFRQSCIYGNRQFGLETKVGLHVSNCCCFGKTDNNLWKRQTNQRLTMD